MTIEGNMSSGNVWIDGKLLDPIPSQRVKNHSPDGFCWGYGGSGPSQLALAILLRFTDKETAVNFYQDFKWEVIAGLPQENFRIEFDVNKWIKERKDREF